MNDTPTAWAEELQSRRSAFREILARGDCDAGLVFGSPGHDENFRYFTSFAPVLGDAWAIFGADATVACVLNFTWQLEEARRKSGIESWTGRFDAVPAVLKTLAALEPARLGLAGLDRLPAPALEEIRARFPDLAVVDTSADVARLRRTKSPLEIERLREASRITDAALEALYRELKPGISEKELAARLGYEIQRYGAEWAFPTCVISGVDDPIPIRNPTDREIREGDTVMVDLGAAVEGYNGDASRTVVLGEASPEQERVWRVVTQAYEAALAVIGPGVPCVEIQRAAVAVIEAAGHDVAHRIGHGIGLATSFEWPSLDSEETPLAPGMTFCVEPGVYVRGAGNMKLEDDVLVTEDGYELLTHASRDLVLGT